jgi:hypothetical protein
LNSTKVVPGLLVAMALRFDKVKGYAVANGYYCASVLGYSFGMVLTGVAVIVFRYL